MAVLAKIRQRSALMIGVIAFALFAFIVQDLYKKGSISSQDVGSVNGKDIAFEDFRIKVANLEKSGQGISGAAAANRIWDQEVSVALLNAEFEKLGLRVGEKHLIEIFKQDPNIGKNPMFLNAAGIFDINKFKAFFQSNPEQAQMLKEREKDAELNAKFQIYNNLIKSANFVTDAEAKLRHQLDNNKVDFAFVGGMYSSIKDSEVKVSDDEILDYMKKREKKFKAEESRELEYVLFEEKASPADENDIKAKINGMLNGSVVYNNATGKNDTLPSFRNAKNIAEFVNQNSDVPYDSSYVPKKNLPAVDADKLFALPAGAIYGPYMNGKYYCISKSMGMKNGVNAKASHILISYQGTQVANQKEKRTKEEAKAKAQEILAQVTANPDSFMMLALSQSDDSSAQQGGDLGYFEPNQMVKPFNDFVFGNPIGKIGLVETPFGFHIIKVTDKMDGIRLATIALKMAPSEVTANKIFTEASQFEMNAEDKDFAQLAKDSKLTVAPAVSVRALDEYVGALGAQRNIVRWAFQEDTKKGSVKRFEIANIGHVIARLKDVNKTGFAPIADVRPFIEPILKNKKKAEMLTAKMKGATLEEIAKAVGAPVQQATAVALANAVLPGGMGQEGKVVGTAFALAPNKISAPIEGVTGVYVVKNVKSTKAPALKSYTEIVKQLTTQNSGEGARVLPALKNMADIKDDRYKFNF